MNTVVRLAFPVAEGIHEHKIRSLIDQVRPRNIVPSHCGLSHSNVYHLFIIQTGVAASLTDKYTVLIVRS